MGRPGVPRAGPFSVDEAVRAAHARLARPFASPYMHSERYKAISAPGTSAEHPYGRPRRDSMMTMCSRWRRPRRRPGWRV